jgi:GntR family transcriptional regulator
VADDTIDAGRTAKASQPIRRENRVMPLYHQVEQLIRYRIATLQYGPGTQIPSEHELGRELSVSRVTVREALRDLVRENLLVKAQGKGTFVTLNPPTDLPPVKYTGFLEDLYERVLKLEVTSVSMGRVPVTERIRALLHITPTDHEVVRIKRRREISGEPFSFTVNYLPAEIGDRIEADALYTLPLNAVLERDLHVPIVRAQETVEAAPADPEVAEQLSIPVLYPVMHVTRVMFTEGGRAFEIVETYYRADKYQYSVSLVRVKRDGKWTWSHALGEDTVAKAPPGTEDAPAVIVSETPKRRPRSRAAS